MAKIDTTPTNYARPVELRAMIVDTNVTGFGKCGSISLILFVKLLEGNTRQKTILDDIIIKSTNELVLTIGLKRVRDILRASGLERVSDHEEFRGKELRVVVARESEAGRTSLRIVRYKGLST